MATKKKAKKAKVKKAAPKRKLIRFDDDTQRLLDCVEFNTTGLDNFFDDDDDDFGGEA